MKTYDKLVNTFNKIAKMQKNTQGKHRKVYIFRLFVRYALWVVGLVKMERFGGAKHPQLNFSLRLLLYCLITCNFSQPPL